MTKASDNDFPSILVTEQGSAPTTPAASHQRMYIRTSDHTLVTVNSSGTVTPVGASASGSITSSGYTQNTAKMLGRSTASSGAIEEITVGSGLTLSGGSLTASGGGITQAFAGYNTAGASWETFTNRKVFCKQITLANDCLMTSIDAYLRPSTDNIGDLGVALLKDNSTAPGALIARGSFVGGSGLYLSVSSSMPGQANWISTPLGAWVTAGTYWLCVFGILTYFDIAYDGSGSDQTFVTTGFSIIASAYPSVFTITTTARKFSIRANTIR